MRRVIRFEIDQTDDPSKTCDGHCWLSADQLKLRTTDGEQGRVWYGERIGVKWVVEKGGWGVYMSFAHCCDLFVQEREGSRGFGRRWGTELKHSRV